MRPKSTLHRTVLTLVYLFSLSVNVARCGKADQDSAQLRLTTGCKDNSYETHLISEDPLVIYVDGFISQEEALQLVSLRYGIYSKAFQHH